MPKDEKKERKEKRKSVSSSKEKEDDLVNLPEGWERRRSVSKGTEYFKNCATGETSWQPPVVEPKKDKDKKKDKKESKTGKKTSSSSKIANADELEVDEDEESYYSHSDDEDQEGQESYCTDDYETDAWVEKWSDRKEKPYWKNKGTGETTWKVCE